MSTVVSCMTLTSCRLTDLMSEDDTSQDRHTFDMGRREVLATWIQSAIDSVAGIGSASPFGFASLGLSYRQKKGKGTFLLYGTVSVGLFKALYTSPQADLFMPTPSQLLWEEFSHVCNYCAKTICSYIHLCLQSSAHLSI